MGDKKSLFEVGDFTVEYNGVVLGNGKVIVSLNPQLHEIRRDGMVNLQSKKIKSLRWTVSAFLKNGDDIWNLFVDNENQFSTDILAGNGLTLKLYPTDGLRRGYEFKRVYLAGVEHVSGETANVGSVKVMWVCEADSESGCYFSTLPEDAEFPEKQKDFQLDLKIFLPDLQRLLAAKLTATANQDFFIDYIAPHSRNSYSLELEKCRDWTGNTPQVLDFTLAAYFAPEEKFSADQSLYSLAQSLHRCRLDVAGADKLMFYVRELDFSGIKVISGNTYSCSKLKFSLLQA